MTETVGPVIAIALVLCAVFVPTAFMAGISGQFFKQFALTIAASTVISAFNSLTLSPALCVLLLKPHGHGEHGHAHQEALPRLGIVLIGGLVAMFFLVPYVAPLFGLSAPGHGEHATNGTKLWALRSGLFVAGAVAGWLLASLVNLALGAFFRAFNWGFEQTTALYGHTVALFLRLSVVLLLVYGGLMGLTYLGFKVVPVGFIPQQDKGYLVVNAQLPDGASLERSDEVVRRMTKIAMETKGVAHAISVPGYSILTSSNISNVGGMFVILKPFEERAGHPELSADPVMAQLRKAFREIQEAQATVFGAPPIDGLGTTGGFKMQVQDRAGLGLEALQGAVDNVTSKGNSQPGLVGLFSSFSANQPQLFVDVDRVKAKKQGVTLSDVFDTLQIYLGSAYANDITLFNRNWQVNIQADARYRLRAEDVGKLKVRNAEGEMVPLETMITVKDVAGPAIVNHYNSKPSAEVSGGTAPGVSSGQAITLMEQIARQELPAGMGFEWTELTYQQIEAGKDLLTKLVFPLAVVFVFLVLAAQYESWSLPLAIILIVPMCLLAAIAGLWLARMDNNIFTQIGLVVLVGLASKNAILIVEFAKQLQDEGKPRFEATVEASKLRLRPILMTSFAFILGVVPLVLAKGAGAEMRVALGTAVFSGMLGVTLFGIFFTPVFYVVIRWFTERAGPAPAEPVKAAMATDGSTTTPVATSPDGITVNPVKSH
jgi:multidrug efflux pump